MTILSQVSLAEGNYRNFNSSSLNKEGRGREGVWLFIYPNTSMFVKNTLPRLLFSSLFWVFENAINHRISSFRYYLYDENVATVSWLYQILTTLHISHDFRNSHNKHRSKLVCLWEFFDCT